MHLGLQLETKAILHQLFSLRIQKNVPVDFLVDGFARCLGRIYETYFLNGTANNQSSSLLRKRLSRNTDHSCSRFNILSHDCTGTNRSVGSDIYVL
jgi:hypothetical protein